MRISKHAAAAPYLGVVAKTAAVPAGEMHHLYDAAYKGLTLAAVGLPLITATAMGASALYKKMTEANRKADHFKTMLNQNPHLRDRDPVLVQRYFNTLHNMNPDMAKDPTVAASFVNNMAMTGNDPRTPHRDLFAQALQLQAGYGKARQDKPKGLEAANSFSLAMGNAANAANALSRSGRP